MSAVTDLVTYCIRRSFSGLVFSQNASLKVFVQFNFADHQVEYIGFLKPLLLFED